MSEEKEDRRLDALLDSLLSDYSSAEPRPGLEVRIRAGLRAHAAQRPRQWMLMATASAAVVALVVMMTTAHTSKPRAPGNVAVGTSSGDPGPGVQATPPLTPAKAVHRLANRRADVGKNTRSQILLQVVKAMPGADNLVFEREKLYLSPEPQQAPEPAIDPQPSAPSINIHDLGVQTIEIKDLPSTKGMDSKGNL